MKLESVLVPLANIPELFLELAMGWLAVDTKSGTKCPNRMGTIPRLLAQMLFLAMVPLLLVFLKSRRLLIHKDISSSGFLSYRVNVPQRLRTLN